MATLNELLDGATSRTIGYLDFGPEAQHPLELVDIKDGMVDVYAYVSGIKTMVTKAWDGRETIEELADYIFTDYLGVRVVLT